MSRYFSCCYSLVVEVLRYLYFNLHLCLQCLDNGGTKGIANVTDPRRRIDERALEKEEEDYFNEDRYISFLRTVGFRKFFTTNMESDFGY